MRAASKRNLPQLVAIAGLISPIGEINRNASSGTQPMEPQWLMIWSRLLLKNRA